MRNSRALPNVIADASAAPFAYRAAMNRLIPHNPAWAYLVLRSMVALVFLSHTLTRMATDRVTPFGKAFDAWGWPFGIYWAWGVTIWELAGGVLLLLGVKPWLVSLVFVVQMVFGIYLVHLKHGWFVVGHGFNGMEYSVTLIAALFAIALTAPRELPRPADAR
jgi:putative oxidoreductase